MINRGICGQGDTLLESNYRTGNAFLKDSTLQFLRYFHKITQWSLLGTQFKTRVSNSFLKRVRSHINVILSGHAKKKERKKQNSKKQNRWGEGREEERIREKEKGRKWVILLWSKVLILFPN